MEDLNLKYYKVTVDNSYFQITILVGAVDQSELESKIRKYIKQEGYSNFVIDPMEYYYHDTLSGGNSYFECVIKVYIDKAKNQYKPFPYVLKSANKKDCDKIVRDTLHRECSFFEWDMSPLRDSDVIAIVE